MSTLTLTPRQMRDLIAPVLPMVSTDDSMPVINAVRIYSRGRWLVAEATDRFRIGIQRIEKYATDDDPTTEWPEFEALIPLRAVKSMLATFKPARRSAPVHEIRLTVEGDRLKADAAGGFDLFDGASLSWALESGEYPDLYKLVREALATPDSERATGAGLNPAFLKDFAGLSGFDKTLSVQFGAPGKAIVLTDDQGFIGLLMPRKRIGESSEDWSDLLDPKPAAKKLASRKGAAA